MKVDVLSLKTVLNLFQTQKHFLKLRIPIFSYDGKKIFEKNEIIDSNLLIILENNYFEYVDILQEKKLLEILNKIDPKKFQLPTDILNRDELEKKLIQLEYFNRRSLRSRRLICCADVFDKKGTLIFSYGEQILFLKWKIAKPFLNKEDLIAIRPSENKILLYLNFYLNKDLDKEKVSMNSNLIYNLINLKKFFNDSTLFKNFDPKLDLLIVTHPDFFLDVYKKNNDIKLVIIGDELNNFLKKEIIKVKAYDLFVKLMYINNEIEKEDHPFLHKVEENYKKDFLVTKK